MYRGGRQVASRVLNAAARLSFFRFRDRKTDMVRLHRAARFRVHWASLQYGNCYPTTMADSSIKDSPASKRYEAVAADIVRLHRCRHAARAGDRLPSVRQASRARRVSVSTIFQAYYLLEARGTSRPVIARATTSARASSMPPEPLETSRPDGNPAPVDVGRRWRKPRSGIGADPDMVPFRIRLPGAHAFSAGAPGVRAGSAGLRRMDP